MKFNGVCLDCSERAVGCHSTCERYKEAKELYKEESGIFRNSKKSEYDFYDFKAKAITAIKNRHKRR